MGSAFIGIFVAAVVGIGLYVWLRGRAPGADVGAAASEDKNQDGKERFRQEIAAVLRADGGFARVHAADDFALAVTTAGGHESTVFLGNLYVETREVPPAERQARIERFVAAQKEGTDARPGRFEDVRKLLVPVLRGATFGIEMLSKSPGMKLVRQPFLPLLDVLFAIDRAHSMGYLGVQQLADWKIDEETARAAAWARIERLDKPKVKLYGKENGPVWMVDTDDSYESSRLLVPGWLASFRDKVEGTPIAIVPERATLLVGGDAKPALLDWMLVKAEREYEASPRRVSPAIYTVDGEGRVVPYERGGSDSLAARIQAAHEKLAVAEHAEQKAALDRLHDESGPDVFVATYEAFIEPDGAVRSRCVWTKSVPTWLPHTDQVSLVRLPPEGSKGQPKVSTVAFERIADRLKQVPGVWPTRFEAGTFPTEDEIAPWR